MLRLVSTEREVFHLQPRDDRGWRALLAPVATTALRQMLCLREMNGIHSTAVHSSTAMVRSAAAADDTLRTTFAEHVLQALQVEMDIAAADLERIPREGPLLVVANHPFGAVDGLMLYALLARVRPDVRILANSLLLSIPELRSIFLPVDVLDGAGALGQNVSSLRRAYGWLKQGGCLGMFPAGEVASWRWQQLRVTDPAWPTHAVRMIKHSDCQVVPLYFHGQNRWRFHLAGLLHPRLRTLLLPREMLARRGSTLRVSVGQVISRRKLERCGSDANMLQYLRFRCEALGLPEEAPAKQVRSSLLAAPPSTLREGASPEHIEAELQALPAEQKLLQAGSMHVYTAVAPQIPHTLRELGRLREATFRSVGEGTGSDIDLDRADDYYDQLFIWDQKARRLVGGYRIGRVDKILQQHGVESLYTHSLFRYRRELLDGLGPALELGRSFVCLEYQRTPASLYLLWRGIAEYVYRLRHYRVLFGPVTISGAYRSLSTHLMVEFLRTRAFRADLAAQVQARHPWRRPSLVRHVELQRAVAVLPDIRALSDTIAGIESDGKPLPMLVEHYVRLGGRFLDFSVDPQFQAALDGLVVVDLRDTDPQILGRYMGSDKARRFLEHHGVAAAAAQSTPSAA